jgi:DtxR family Mn-dependent transcriptional regulator
VAPDSGRSRLSRSTEDYLKVIHELESQGGSAQTGAIAAALAIAPPSVSGMVKRLSEMGMLEYEPYRGVHLTRAGRREALRIVRRHRVLETYLTSKLGYGWDSVHEEAERLEHAVSDELIERMAMAVGNPQYDPHGAPIPSKDGEIKAPATVPLSEVPVGETAELRMVDGRDPDVLRYLASLGLRIGAVFEVIARQPFRGPVSIRLLGNVQREQVVGHSLAESLGCALRGHEVG